jgi:hypothetical protein
MRTKFWVPVVPAIVVGGSVLGVSLSVGADPLAAHGPPIHVQEQVTNATYVSIQKLLGSTSGTNQGDYVTFDDPLVQPSSGHPAGTVMGTCWAENVAATLFFCSVDFILNNGQITVVGPFDATGNTTTSAAITGGTGAYASAKGQATVTAVSSTVNDFVLRLDS